MDETDSELDFIHDHERPGFIPLSSCGRQHSRREYDMVCDMRAEQNLVEGSIMSSDHLKQRLHDRPECVSKHAGRLPRDNMRLIVLAPKDNGRYLLIKLQACIYCLRIQNNNSVMNIFEQLRQIVPKTATIARIDGSYGFSKVELRFPDGNLLDSVAVFFKNTRVAPQNILDLPDLAVVDLVPAFPVSWSIYHRYKLNCDVRYRIRCSSLDTLADVKRKFLDVFTACNTEGEEALSVDSVWFVQKNNLVTDALLTQTFQVMITESEENLFQRKYHTSLRLTEIEKPLGVDEVFVYFQPPDAVCTEVALRTDRETVVGSLVLSPVQSVHSLREEVSKLVGRNKNSIEISLGNNKLHKINQPEIIVAAGCKITVKIKEKISLSVRICGSCDDAKMQNIRVYGYDRVDVLKNELFRLTWTPQHLVDLYFEGRLLAEANTFYEYRIRDQDQLEARVFPNRRNVCVRMPDRVWCQLIVDDCSTVTIGQIKAFCQFTDPFRGHQLTAIAHSRVADDTELIEDVAGLAQMLRLVLVQTDNMSFTAATSYNGTCVVCASTEGLWFNLVLTSVFGGASPFYGPTIDNEKMIDLLEKRRSTPQQKQPVSGLRLFLNRSAAMKTPPRSSCWSSAPAEDNNIVKNLTASPRAVFSKTSASPPESVNRRTSALSEDVYKPKFGSGRDHYRQTLHHKTQKSSNIQFHTVNSLSDSNTSNMYDEDIIGQKKSKQKSGSADTDTTLHQVDKEIDHDAPVQANESCGSASIQDNDYVSAVARRLPSDLALSHPVPNVTLSTRRNSFPPITNDGKEMAGVMTYCGIYTKNTDGTVTAVETVSSRMTPEEFSQRRLSSPCSPLTLSAHLPQRPSLSTPDPTFRHISCKTLHFIAENLKTNDGMKLMRELEVSDSTIEQAKDAHPYHLVERHFYCLKAWCSKKGSEANVDTLKAALKACERMDLVETMDETERDEVKLAE